MGRHENKNQEAIFTGGLYYEVVWEVMLLKLKGYVNCGIYLWVW